MPEAWQKRGIATQSGQYEYGEPVRSFADILADPMRRVFASKLRGAAAIILFTALLVTFF